MARTEIDRAAGSGAVAIRCQHHAQTSAPLPSDHSNAARWENYCPGADCRRTGVSVPERRNDLDISSQVLHYEASWQVDKRRAEFENMRTRQDLCCRRIHVPTTNTTWALDTIKRCALWRLPSFLTGLLLVSIHVSCWRAHSGGRGVAWSVMTMDHIRQSRAVLTELTTALISPVTMLSAVNRSLALGRSFLNCPLRQSRIR